MRCKALVPLGRCLDTIFIYFCSYHSKPDYACIFIDIRTHDNVILMYVYIRICVCVCDIEHLFCCRWGSQKQLPPGAFLSSKDPSASPTSSPSSPRESIAEKPPRKASSGWGGLGLVCVALLGQILCFIDKNLAAQLINCCLRTTMENDGYIMMNRIVCSGFKGLKP